MMIALHWRGFCQIPFCNQGQCDWTDANDGEACEDGEACTENDQCQSGECIGILVCECLTDTDCGSDTPPACTEVQCSSEGACISEILPDGSTCDDGDLCTEADSCTDGKCNGIPTAACDCSGSGIWLNEEEQCSLKQAIEEAESGASIQLDFGEFVLNPTSRNGDLTIVGSGLSEPEVTVSGESGLPSRERGGIHLQSADWRSQPT